MKLLIVDDEELTREGLISSINWDKLGISQIFQADDGIHALQMAKAQHPDIILCDVRMPRMDGIRFVGQLEPVLPDTAVIFMSGYSDKEYLKAAIKLKAVNYVEKPLNPLEIEDAVLEARELRLKNLHTRKTESLYSMETASKLALLLTRPYKENRDEVDHLAAELSLRLMPGSSFTAFIVKLDTTAPDSITLNDIWHDMEEFLALFHLQSFYVSVHAVFHVFHIYGNCCPSSNVITDISRQLARLFAATGRYYISRGETVNGISRAWQSYSSAVVLMQSSFFYNTGTFLEPAADEQKVQDGSFDAADLSASYCELLEDKKKERCYTFLEGLFASCSNNHTYLPNQIKDLYYKLLTELNVCRQKAKLPPDSLTGNTEHTVLEHLESCFTYGELHETLLSRTKHYFSALETYTPDDTTIFHIKDYISQHYSEDSLSIKDVSNYVFLSASYVCTYFKNQTGRTLNQYLTEYRMEKAKQLLGDSRYPIADISAKVGYSNGNYFSKTFKKYTGLTPSKYRENILN